MVSKMDLPIYNENESISRYLQKMEDYKMYIKTSDYNKVLDIINDLINIDNNKSFDSLLEFKNIPSSVVKNNINSCSNILYRNREFINGLINGSISSKIKDDHYIFYCIMKIVKAVGYKLRKREIDGEYYYSVVLRR